MKRLRDILTVSMTIAALIVLPSCSSGGDQSYSPAATPTETATAAPPETPAGGQGEIWAWALGKSWDDPALAEYTGDLSQDGTYVAAVRLADGFKLLFDPSSGICKEVLLVNDEASLGFPPDSLFEAYPGRLPGGLTWDMTGPEVLARLGDPDASYTAGYGVELSFTWRDVDGYGLVVSSAARHQKDFSAARIHDIQVTETD